jgi:LmbE family N-acetylglucosaminyl deacetylase
MTPASAHLVTVTTCDIAPEWRRSMRILDPASSTLWAFTKRTLADPAVRVHVRKRLEDVRDRVGPDVVFTHHLHHRHQDHQAVAEETRRVFKWHTIYGYGLDGDFRPNAFVPVTEAALTTKLRCLRCYKSQHTHRDGGQPRYFQSPDTIRGAARWCGAMIRQPYAEAFSVIRRVGV